MKLATTNSLVIVLLLIGCAKEQPYDSLEVPDKQIFPKDIISEGVDGPGSGGQAKMEQMKRASDSEFLFLASTLGAPRSIPSQFPNFQGDPKIVKFRFERDGLKVYQVEEDERFEHNSLNERPVLTIPVEHMDFKCATNDMGDCTNKEILDEEKNWQEKRYFAPDFDQINLTHMSDINLFIEDSCFTPVSQKTLHVELTKDVLNMEIEKEFKLIDDWICIFLNFDFKSFAVENPSFKVRYFYSIVRLNQLESEDYEAIEYPLQEQFVFGFFKNHTERLDDNFDLIRPQETYYLNRFNPGQDSPRVIDFHLNANFNRSENLYLRDATHRTVEMINRSLMQARANIQLNLVHAKSQEEEKRSGDLRYNTIVLIDDPLTRNILGYGPSVGHPRTGEILQAHTNMYSGTLRSGVRRTYQAMVRLSRQNDERKVRTTLRRGVNPRSRGTENRPDENKAVPPEGGERDMEREWPSMATPILPQTPFSQTSLLGVNHQHLMGEEESRAMDFQKLIDLHSQNNAYHIEMVQFQNLGKELMPGIVEIADITNSEGHLKPWEKLNREQRVQVTEIVMVNLYSAILAHELLHNLGVKHNFMGSVDRRNFYSPQEAKALGMWNAPNYSSLMDYVASDLNRLLVLGKYDIAALRYAYAREVELARSGGMVKISTTLTELRSELAQEGKYIKHYLFCSDEGAGQSAFCGRADEGSSLEQIARFYVEAYESNYWERNWRNGRPNFKTYQLPRYISKTIRHFRLMRKIYEEYEFYASIYGENIMANGCHDQMAHMDPNMCAIAADVSSAVMIVGNFFLDLLKTPEHLCSLIPADEDEKEVEMLVIPLRGLYYRMAHRTLESYVPKSCFDTPVQEYLADPSNPLRRSFKVKGEAGKYLNSITDPDPLFPFVSDIRVRGIWSDKLLAMKYLTTRTDEHPFGRTLEGRRNDVGRGSLADIPAIATTLGDFFDHVLTRSVLDSPVKFRRADGSEFVEDHFDLVGTKYQIYENPNPYVAHFFGFHNSGRGILNKALITNAIWYNKTEDFNTKSRSEAFQDSLSIFRVRRTTPINSASGQTEFELGKYIYIPERENRIALKLVEIKETLEKLEEAEVSPEVATAVLEARTTPPPEIGPTATIVIQWLVRTNITSSEVSPNPPYMIQVAIRQLNIQGRFQEVLDIFNEMSIPPEDATPQEEAVYSVKLSLLQGFIEGHLQRRAESFEESLELLNYYSEF